MRFDLPLGFEPTDAAARARAAEDAGIDGVWSAEAGHDPYLPLALAASVTTRTLLGSAIAVAFARSPMVHAQVGWDLHRMAPGRFVLGLGAQVKAHNLRRYSAPHDHPVARLADMIGAIRSIWRCWQDGTPLDYRGAYYTHTLMTPFFNPGPVDHPAPPPIYVAAVTPPMLRMAGAVADGVHVHPLHTEASLDQLTLAITHDAATAAGRDPDTLAFVVPAMIATGRTSADARVAREPVRAQIAFYASTPTYRPVLEVEGRGEVGDRLAALARRGDWAAMPELIDDELLDRVCTTATWDGLAAALMARYQGRATRLMPYTTEMDGAPWHDVATQLRAA